MKKKSFEILYSIKKLLIEKNLLKPNENFCLAISGGQDSMFLLILIFILKRQWNFEIKMIYCNHLWQKNSIFSYLHISKIAFSLNLELIQSIRITNLESEEQSRYWRLKNFDRINNFLCSSKILIGHTRTDQIETFFFNTLRGSGITGSLSIREKNNFYLLKKNIFQISKNQLNKNYFSKKKIIQNKKKFCILKKQIISIKRNKLLPIEIIRPLIKKNRFDTKSSCETWKLPLFPDTSNQITNYSRNRLRKELLPICRFYFNPKVDISLDRHTNILFDQENYLTSLIENLLKILITEDENGYFFNMSLFYSLPSSLQRRICFYFFKEKIKTNYNLVTIDSFLFFSKKKFLRLEKKHKNDLKKNIVIVFFPEIGTIYFINSLIMFIK